MKQLSFHFKLYGITAILLLIGCFIDSSTIDFSTHDTYVVMPGYFITLVFALLFSLCAILIQVMHASKRPLRRIVLNIHYLMTVAGMISLTLITWYLTYYIRNYSNYETYNEADSNALLYWVNYWISVIVVLCLLAQLLFVIHFIWKLVATRAQQT